MNTQDINNCDKNTMTLKEPRRKRRVRLRPNKPFPINIGSDDEWTVYTGHLSDLGVCVTNSYEIEALHSMGFFGKGSLSRSYPNFEKTRGGVPLVVRQRQLARRQVWLEQAKDLDARAAAEHPDADDREESQSVTEVRDAKTNENTSKHSEEVAKHVEVKNLDDSFKPPVKKFKHGSLETSKCPENNCENENEENNHSGTNRCDDNDIVSDSEGETLLLNPLNNNKARLPESRATDEKSDNVKVAEVVLYSSEEEDEICEISNIETTESTDANVSCDKDIILLNNDKMSMDFKEMNFDETEDKETNINDDIEMLEQELLVLPDSDSDVEDYLSKVKPTIQKEGFPVRETMYLTFEESFFLMFGLGCLQIVDFDGNLMTILDAWNHFCQTQNDFVQRYVIYHYFRSKGWVVKSGLKYGGDFLLYKQGPPFYHASYIVVVEVLDADTSVRDEQKTTRKMTWKKLFGLDRLSETAAKEILFAQVLWPSKISRIETPSTPELLAEFTVKELLYRRWIPKQKREEIDLENDNEELRQ